MKIYYKVLSLIVSFAPPKEVWFRTEAEAKEAVEGSDTAVYEGPVEISDPDEIQRIEDEIGRRDCSHTDEDLEKIVSSVVNETLSLFGENK